MKFLQEMATLSQLAVMQKEIFYERLKPVVKKYKMKNSEVILLFLLYLNPSRKTAKEICRQEGLDHSPISDELSFPEFSRVLKPAKAGRIKCKAMGTDTVLLDREPIDVRYLEQLADEGQTIGLVYLMQYILSAQKQPEKITELIERIYKQIGKNGFESVVPPNYSCGQPVLPRKQELAACLSRYRQAKIQGR